MAPPPKKKPKLLNPNHNVQPGTARKHIFESYSSLPDDISAVKNGHILYVYLTAGDNKSRAATKKFLQSHFSHATAWYSL